MTKVILFGLMILLQACSVCNEKLLNKSLESYSQKELQEMSVDCKLIRKEVTSWRKRKKSQGYDKPECYKRNAILSSLLTNTKCFDGMSREAVENLIGKPDRQCLEPSMCDPVHITYYVFVSSKRLYRIFVEFHADHVIEIKKNETPGELIIAN